MSAAIVQILGKRAFGSLKERQTNFESPYYEADMKTLRPLPEGLSKRDLDTLKRVRRRAHKWDMSFRFCCFQAKFGWSFVIGLIPIVGDIADLLVARSIIKHASSIEGGLPREIIARMWLNIILDFGIGLVPFLGDLMDAFYRANSRNAWLLDAYLFEKARALREGKAQDPETGKQVGVPVELRSTDVELGMAQAPANPQAQGGKKDKKKGRR